MKRFRALAAVVACLAVLASGVMTVTAVAAPSAAPTSERSASNPPCSHCDGMPCPMPAASCLHVSSNVAPILVASAIDLPAADLGKVLWSVGTTTLTGLSPPPDPFPPRA